MDRPSIALKRAERLVRKRLRFMIDGFQLEPLAGDASTRCYFRLFLPRVPAFTSAVIMLLEKPFRLESSDFYQVGEVLRKINLPVPKIYESFERDGAMILEDLGDIHLCEMAEILEGDEEGLETLYRQAIDSIIVLQTRAPHYSDGVAAFSRAFDVPKLRWELDFMLEHFAGSLAGFRPGPAERKLLDDFFEDLCGRLAALPRVFCHRDYHSRNLMARGGKLHILDFQDARMGPRVYDLVSLLGDSYMELDPEMRLRLLEYYAAAHPGCGVGDLPAIVDEFRLTALQRHLKHLGTFGYQSGRGRRFYLRYIPLTLSYLEENFTLFPEYSHAAESLGKVFEAARRLPPES